MRSSSNVFFSNTFNINQILFNTKQFIAIALISFFILLSTNLQSSKAKNGIESISLSNTERNNKMRMLIDENLIKLFIQDMKEQVMQKEKLFISVFNKGYEGTWKSIDYAIGESHSGKVNLKIIQAREIFTKQQGIVILFRLFENQFVDHWTIFNSYIKLTDLKFNKDNENEISFFGFFNSQSEKGEYFSKNLKSYQSNIIIM